jgi:hypothetical protein
MHKYSSTDTLTTSSCGTQLFSIDNRRRPAGVHRALWIHFCLRSYEIRVWMGGRGYSAPHVRDQKLLQMLMGRYVS